jgi:hypothetical protein
MICYECGHQIKRDFARFCDHCGSSLEVRAKPTPIKKDIEVSIDEEIDRATNLFILWNAVIVTSLISYIVHILKGHYFYLFLFTLFMLALSWMLLLIKLYDLTHRKHSSIKKFVILNFCIPILGTFYYFLKLSQKK